MSLEAAKPDILCPSGPTYLEFKELIHVEYKLDVLYCAKMEKLLKTAFQKGDSMFQS